MRKTRSFEEHSIQNFEIQLQFDKIMQIEGLSLTRQQPKDPFPSIKSLFHANTGVNIIGHGPNANIRAFYYLLLCHIRKEHLKKLVNDQRQKQADELSQQQDFRRDRKVSFNGKGAVFLNGPQYQNYALHKLRIYAFSLSTDLSLIENSPFEKDPILRFKGQRLGSLQLKKLLSQFLKELLPSQIPQDYKNTLKSVRYHLNKHRVAGIVLAMVMRHVLFSNYEIASARNFQEEVNDHTVCTTLCDAFAIDGLLCRDNLYEINTWCKVYSVGAVGGRQLFVEMFNDQFQDLGLVNDKKGGLMGCREVAAEMSISSRKESLVKEIERQQSSQALPSFQGSVSASQNNNSSQPCPQSESNSMMSADEDSQISYGGEEWRQARDCEKAGLSEQFKSIGQHSGSYNDGFRQTFNSNRKDIQATILQQMQNNGEKEDQVTLNVLPPKQENSQSMVVEQDLLNENSTGRSQNEQKIDPCQTCQLNQQNDGQNDRTNIAKFPQTQPKQFAKKSGVDMQQGCTPANFLQKLAFSRKKNVRMIRIGIRQDEQRSSVVNNNISNNIYVNLGDSGKPMQVINISTGKSDPNCINIKLT